MFGPDENIPFITWTDGAMLPFPRSAIIFWRTTPIEAPSFGSASCRPDPAILAIVRSLARQAARDDHEQHVRGRK